MIGIIFDRYQN